MAAKAKEQAVRSEDVAAVQGVPAQAAAEPAKPAGPRFGICEGTREELQRLGVAVDPFTGRKLTRDDLKQDGDG